jgi:nucleotide-binding universal stress UspA family protein
MIELTHAASCPSCAPEWGAGPVVVVIDDPAHARSALQCARRLAGIIGRDVELIHAANPPLSKSAVFARLGLSVTAAADIRVTPIPGAPLDVLTRVARERNAALLVVALPALGRPLGAIREHILGDAQCPVLFVPSVLSANWGQSGRVLMPLDGTPTMAAAFPLAVELAFAFSDALDILHVAGDVSAEPGALAVPRFLDQTQHEWAAWRAEFLERFCTCRWGGARPIDIRLLVRAGSAADAIRRVAAKDRTDLVIAGWRGRIDGRHAITLRDILSGSDSPVLALKLSARPCCTCGSFAGDKSPVRDVSAS